MGDAPDSLLVKCGPFYRFLCGSKLYRGSGRADIVRLSLAFLTITWLPVVVLEAFRSGFRIEHMLLLHKFSVHTRFLVAAPLLIAAEETLHRLCKQGIASFAGSGFVRAADGDPTPALVRRAEKWSGSPAVESALAFACFGTQLGVWTASRRTGLLADSVFEGGLSPGQVWYVFFSLPLINFLLLRLVYRWLVWAWLLYRFSRLPLRLVPTHPDNAGGLGPLAEPTLGFSLVLAALGAVLASIWADRSIQDGVRVTTFSNEFSIIVLLGQVWAFAPLASFSARLVQTRLQGLIDYGALALRYTRAFHERWVETRDDDGLLGTSDIQSLADLSNSFEVIEKMRVVPFRPRHMIVVFAAMAAPMLPLVLTEVPVHDLLTRVGRTMLGGLPP